MFRPFSGIPFPPQKPQTSMTTNANTTLPNETSTWQRPGAWRKPCIVHVTMVAKRREPIFGKLIHTSTKAAKPSKKHCAERPRPNISNTSP